MGKRDIPVRDVGNVPAVVCRNADASLPSLAAGDIFKRNVVKVSRGLAAELHAVAASGRERAIPQRDVERVDPPPNRPIGLERKRVIISAVHRYAFGQDVPAAYEVNA